MLRRHPIFSILAALSLLLFIVIAVLWLLSFRWHPSDLRLGAIAGRWHIHIGHGELVLFGDDENTPGWSTPTETSKHHLLGIQWGMQRWSNGATWLHLIVPLIYPLLLTAVLPVIWIIRRARLRRRGATICAKCGYDLRGSEGACPECGQAPATIQKP